MLFGFWSFAPRPPQGLRLWTPLGDCAHPDFRAWLYATGIQQIREALVVEPQRPRLVVSVPVDKYLDNEMKYSPVLRNTNAAEVGEIY